MLEKTAKVTGVEIVKGFEDLVDFFNKTLVGINRLGATAPDYLGDGIRTDVIYDLTQNSKAYYLEFEVPGVEIDQVGLEVKDNVITVSVDQKKETTNRKVRYQFKKYMVLPTDVTQKDISASMKSGVLKITLPKAKPAVKEGKKISITEE